MEIDEQILLLNNTLNKEKLLFSEFMHKSIGRIQKETDSTTTFIYQYLKPDIDVVFQNVSKGYKGLIVPIIKYNADDIASNYNSKIDLVYVLTTINPLQYPTTLHIDFIDTSIEVAFQQMLLRMDELKTKGINVTLLQYHITWEHFNLLCKELNK